MNKIYVSRLIPLLLLIQILLINCKKDATIDEPLKPVPDASIPNKFIWNGLHDYYLWVDQVPNLSNTKFSNKDSLNLFLNKYSDPEDLFYDLLYKYQVIDKWSFIVDDSKEIENWIAGISKTVGMDFMLGRIGSSNNLFGFVRYILKGSPADLAGIKRGDIFIKVNDQQLNVSNYQSLLFTNETYKLSFAEIVNNVITPLDKSITVTAIEMQENPILLDTVYNINGANIGYLVYNGFNAEFDIQLYDVFKDFKNRGISTLILDLRYNGGGSVQTAIYLASMIYSTDKNKIFSKSQFNKGLQDYYVDEYGAAALNDYFTDKIIKTPTAPETTISTLGLTKMYVITSDNTASASELLINGLKPYLNVISVGIETTGKYVGSFTLQDVDDNGNVNPRDPWAMQPIVVKMANSLNVSDYVNGLAPDIRAEEDIANLLSFGNDDELLLKVVLDDIKGLPRKSMILKSAALGLKKVADSKDFKRFSKDMYINPESLRDLQFKHISTD